MKLTAALVGTIAALVATTSLASVSGDYLIKLRSEKSKAVTSFAKMGLKLENLGPKSQWIRIQVPASQLKTLNMNVLSQHPDVEYVQPNYKLGLLNKFQIQDVNQRAMLAAKVAQWKAQGLNPHGIFDPVPADNPNIPAPVIAIKGSADPLFKNQWGMTDIGVTSAWSHTTGDSDVVVAVIDTGVDYTHEDLVENMWRNPREIEGNNRDDDGNGYVDDIVGWDFVSNDNKPYDFKTSLLEMLFGGGNPGHGTHCAGNVAARGFNNKGIAGVAPNVKIMALRFISEKGQGTTADAIKSINYAVANGAKVTSNSWGSEGEDPNEAADNKALRDTIQAAQDAGVLFIAAAGNGHQGKGYDNDNDPKPAFPASYDHDIIVSVAALDVNGQLGSFSNWGRNGVDIGAPGVKVFSTTPANGYEDTVIPGELLGQPVTWDGTSMATPHVAGAAALYWSKHPTKNWREVKAAIINSAKSTTSMTGKSVSNGRLDVESLMRY